MEKKKSRAVLAGGIVLFIILLLTVSFLLVRRKPQQITYISCSWTYGYSDVQELTRNSDVIAYIEVDSPVETKGGMVPATYFDVTVTDGIYGCTEGDVLRIYMTGGMDQNGDYLVVDVDPLMKKGQEFLIFAVRNSTGTYTVLGGPQGRFEYRDGLLNSLNHTALLDPAIAYKAKISGNPQTTISLPGSVDVHDKTPDEIMEEIRQGLSQKENG